MIPIVLVDDQNIIREGLKVLLQLEPDIKVVGDAENGKLALELISHLYTIAQQPQVVLMDIRMPVMDGVAATQALCSSYPNIKILILSTFDDESYVGDALRAGACGYLLKDTPSEELAEAIRSIDRGYSQLSPGILQKALGPVSPKVHQSLPPEVLALTLREREVLKLIATGASNREIAQKLFISEGTVKNHVTSILSQLQLRDRTQTAIYASTLLSAL